MIPAAVYRSTIRSFLQPIAALLDDDGVTEVLVNGAVETHRSRKLVKGDTVTIGGETLAVDDTG